MTIEDILTEHNVPHVGAEHRHGRVGWVSVDCPWCGPGTEKFHLGISLSTGASSCWRCGRHSTAQALAILTGISQRQMRELLDTASLHAPIARKRGSLSLPTGIAALLPGHTAYLTERGFVAAHVAALWGVQGIGHVGGVCKHLRWRIFIPVYHHGEVVSGTTGAIKRNAKRRYLL